jgi:hypothetical protein
MIQIRERPPLRRHWLLNTPTGRRYRWGEDEPQAENIPSGFVDTDTMPGGFDTCDGTLPRRPGVDYADLEPMSTLRSIGAGGEIVSEYRLERIPQVSGDEMSISPSAVGWQAALEDDKSVQLLGLDRLLASWQGITASRHAQIGDGYSPVGDGEVTEDPVSGAPGIQLTIVPPIAGSSGALAEIFYDSGAGQRIGHIQLSSAETKNLAGDSNWAFRVYTADDDTYTNFNLEYSATADTAVALQKLSTAAKRWAALQLQYDGAFTGDDAERWRIAKDIAIVGDGFTLYTDPASGIDGILPTDMIELAIRRWAPAIVINSGNIAPSWFIAPQLTFPEMTTVGDLIKSANRFELRHWAVWEGREFFLHEPGARGRHWLLRSGPCKLEATGPQVDRLWESIVVQYTDVDGSTRTVGPPGSGADTETDVLHDPDPDNPANILGTTRRDLLAMGAGTVRSATRVGEEFLARQRELDTSGRASVVGYAEDDRHVLHPYYRIRSGDTVSFIDARDPSPRRVVKASRNDAERSCSIDLDAPPEGLQALLEQLGVVLVPLGIG